jgi:hypothetical protein
MWLNNPPATGKVPNQDILIWRNLFPAKSYSNPQCQVTRVGEIYPPGHPKTDVRPLATLTLDPSDLGESIEIRPLSPT